MKQRTSESYSEMTERALSQIAEILKKVRDGRDIPEAILNEPYERANKSLDIAPNQPKAWACLAIVLSVKSDKEATLMALETAKKLDPSDHLADLVTRACKNKGWI